MPATCTGTHARSLRHAPSLTHFIEGLDSMMNSSGRGRQLWRPLADRPMSYPTTRSTWWAGTVASIRMCSTSAWDLQCLELVETSVDQPLGDVQVNESSHALLARECGEQVAVLGAGQCYASMPSTSAGALPGALPGASAASSICVARGARTEPTTQPRNPSGIAMMVGSGRTRAPATSQRPATRWDPEQGQLARRLLAQMSMSCDLPWLRCGDSPRSTPMVRTVI